MLNKPRCHRCGIKGYLPGISVKLKNVSRKQQIVYYTNNEIVTWHYCKCPAGDAIKIHHDLLLCLDPNNKDDYILPIKQGQKIIKKLLTKWDNTNIWRN